MSQIQKTRLVSKPDGECHKCERRGIYELVEVGTSRPLAFRCPACGYWEDLKGQTIQTDYGALDFQDYIQVASLARKHNRTIKDVVEGAVQRALREIAENPAQLGKYLPA